ncbi:MAG: ATP-dependent helicase HrpA, partial [Gammaproteobacteria bacterium]
MSESVLNELRAMMDQTMLRDRPRLRRMLSSVSQPSVTEAAPRRGRSPVTLDDVTSRILSSIDAVEARVSARPTVTFPANLPVVAQREAIMDMIAAHQVCVICGETGSGKTTQIPKMCIELGRGTKALIGHTQPRRIAARSVSGRIASELGQPLGASIGFKVRFSEEVSAKSLVKVMTDGILVAEIRRDRELLNYDTIIVDEAHERSLNIDFILGYLKRLLPSRPDLKVIVTSATLDAERIAAHFGGAPILNVSGRAYPVEIRYQPLPEEDESGERDTDVRMHSALCDALREATAIGPGDVLVFLSGEREIRDTAELLRKDPAFDVDILPLYARLNISDQQRVFGRGAKKRRVVLATNVAETSLTVPGIRFVIDPGRARISRYSYRTKVQRLPVEPISQASANQRAGRCGRVGPGVCFRLYSQEDFEGREPFTMPEIQRTNLASVILQMAAAKLGQMSDFPFVDAPDHRFVRDGQQLLRDLGATDERDRLTALGTKLARLPLDPQIGRMILASGEFECSAEILVIAAALSVGDPRDRSIERREAAAQAQEEFSD